MTEKSMSRSILITLIVTLGIILSVISPLCHGQVSSTEDGTSPNHTNSLNHPGFSLDYAVDLSEADRNTLHAELTIRTKELSSLNLSINSYHPVNYIPKPENVEFNAEESYGLEVEKDYRYIHDIKVPLWKLSFKEGAEIVVNWSRTFTIQTGDRYHGIIGYLCKDFFMATGAKYLILPEINIRSSPQGIYEEMLQGIKVTYKLPDGWEVWSPWPETGVNGFDAEIYEGDEAAHINLKGLALSTVVAGPKEDFTVFAEDVGKTKVQYVFSRSLDNVEEKADKLYKAFEIIQILWGEALGDKYLAAFVDSSKRVYSGEWTTSQGFSADQGYPGIVGEMFVHQIFHRWNGWLPYLTRFSSPSGSDRYFYSEGWNEYYCDKVLNSLDVFTKDWGLLREWYETYKDKYRGTNKDVAVGRLSDSGLSCCGEDWTFMAYRKSALVTFMLDNKIGTRTNNEFSLDDVVAGIWERYGNRNGYFNYQNIIDILKDITEKDFSGFFDTYVFGNKPLEIPELEGVPQASFSYSPSNPAADEEVTFDASSSADPDGSIEKYRWDWNNDGDYDSTTQSPTVQHKFSYGGKYEVRLQVVDEKNATDTLVKKVQVQPKDTAAVFKIDIQGNVYADKSYHGREFVSGNADLAEKVRVKGPVGPGDVLCLALTDPGHYIRCRNPYSSPVSGVVSTEPGVSMGGYGKSSEVEITMALMGTVPVKTTTENGPIKPGDLLTTSSKPGYAMACKDRSKCSGAIIGKALESLEGGKGKIKMLVVG